MLNIQPKSKGVLMLTEVGINARGLTYIKHMNFISMLYIINTKLRRSTNVKLAK